MLELLTLKQEAFGLDVSDLSLKIANLKKKGDKFYLVSFGEAVIPKGIIEGGEIKDEDSLSNIIKEGIRNVKGQNLKMKYVVCSLPEEKSYLAVIQMPKMKEEELKGAIRFEAENYIPLPIEEVYLDFQIIQPLYNHLDHFDILISAIPKKIVDPYLSTLKKAGLKPLALEIESLAIVRALIKNEVSYFPILLIDLGATRSSFIIFSGTSLRFTSSIPISSQMFTEAISKNLKVDLIIAEELKRKCGIKSLTKIHLKEKTGDTKLEKEIIEDKRIFEALIPALTDLVEQIRTHISYYQSHAGHEHLPSNVKEIKRILLCGGGANLKGLSQFLLKELKIKTEIADPWVNIQRGILEMPLEKSLSYTTALGLALRGAKEV
jgi:type IV pilus assembly protein PilM